MMAVEHKQKYKQPYEMSPDELLALYTEFENLPPKGRQEWMRDHGYHDSTFYTQRRKWLNENPDFQLSEYSRMAQERSRKAILGRSKRQKGNLTSRFTRKKQLEQMANARAVLAERRRRGLIGSSSGKPTVRMSRQEAADFTLADDATRRSMLEEYRKLPVNQKKGFRERHSLSQAMVFKYGNRFFGGILRGTGGPLPAPATANDDTQDLLNEYLRLPGGKSRGKTEWLQAHGLNHQHVFEVKKGIRKSFYDIKSFIPDGRSRALVRPQEAVQQGVLGARPPLRQPPVIDVIDFTQAQPARPEPSLSDAIAAFEVQRDQLNTFIEQLKRMRGVR